MLYIQHMVDGRVEVAALRLTATSGISTGWRPVVLDRHFRVPTPQFLRHLRHRVVCGVVADDYYQLFAGPVLFKHRDNSSPYHRHVFATCRNDHRYRLLVSVPNGYRFWCFEMPVVE